MPVIAVAAAFLPDRGAWRLPAAYAAALREAGGAVLPVPLRENAVLPDEADGLLLPGGGDLSPALYGEAALPASLPPCPANDLGEFALLRQAFARELPVLGVCRGLQSVNVFCGGTLWQEIGAEIPAALCHESGLHAVCPAPESRLSALLGKSALCVNSAHHQAVKKIGQGLRIAAAAPDGVIEALEGENMLAVQWHPERMGAKMRRAVFGWLAAAAENRKNSETAKKCLTFRRNRI